jgi:conjugal transfer pilus assembly protein TraK
MGRSKVSMPTPGGPGRSSLPVAYLARAVAAVVLMAAGVQANALTILDGVEGKKHLVRIPANELTRIGIDGQRMRGFRFKLDELEVDQDKEAGAVYVQPLAKDKQISVFVVSPTGMAHELVLQPVQTMPLESIVIREPASKVRAAGGPPPAPIDRAGSLDLSVKRLVMAMARSDDSSPEVKLERVNTPVALWSEARFVQVGRYSTRSLVGDAYRLQNVSPRPMRILEQELYKPGVVAVVVEAQVLRPGEETNVFVVRMESNGQ